MVLLRCIAKGCKPAWFRLDADPSSAPAGSSASLILCPYCGQEAPLELLFAAAAGSTRVAHEVVLSQGARPDPGPRKPMVRFQRPRLGDRLPPLMPPESDRRDLQCERCTSRYSVYAPQAACPRCGPP